MEDIRVLTADFARVAAFAEPRRSQILGPSSLAISRTYARDVREAARTASTSKRSSRCGRNASGRLDYAPSVCQTKGRRLKYRRNDVCMDRYFD